MLLEQSGLCRICCVKMKDGSTHVDHCHKTGKIRGLLCHRCNPGLAHFDDNPETLIRAAEYLRLAALKAVGV